MRDSLLRLIARLQAEEGQTMVEYGLILALVSIAAVGALTLLGPAVSSQFASVTTSL
jgi:pilus assembly protein Flp/PilA